MATEGLQQHGNKRQEKEQEILNERQETDWRPIFDGLFSKFSDVWDMKLTKVTKRHPLRRKKIWERFLGEKCRGAYFQCMDCKRTWTSNKGWVRFWIWRDEPDANGRRRGHVAAYVFGQKCEKCYDKNVNLGYALGHLPRDEIEAVLSFLLMDIDYHFYGNKNYTNIDENEIENKRRNFQYRRKPPARAHFEKGCQACTFKVCGKGFSKNFPEKVDPTEN